MTGIAGTSRATRRAAALGAIGLMLGAAAPAHAKVDAGTLVDRAEVADLLTRYYDNFGKAGGESFGKFYTDDAEMILGKTSYKGRAAIEGAYKGLANADIPQRKSFSFNVLMTNPLIVVHGAAATARPDAIRRASASRLTPRVAGRVSENVSTPRNP